MIKEGDSTKLKRVPIGEIDRGDTYFKISRNRIDDDLRASVTGFGVLDPPVVVQNGDRLRAVFGLNRLALLAEAGADSAEVAILPRLDEGWYIGRILLKCHRDEVGPVGRVRALAILADYFGVDRDRRRSIASRGMGVPGEFAGDGPVPGLLGELPPTLKNYLDCRGIKFRVIRDLLRLPPGIVEALSSWVAFAPMKVNIFRSVIDMIAGIIERDGGAAPVESIRPDESTDRKQWEEYIHAAVYEARYPEYTAHKRRAEEAAAYFRSRGIHVGFPPFFEGDALDLSIRVSRRDDPGSILEKIGGIEPSRLRKLLDNF